MSCDGRVHSRSHGKLGVSDLGVVTNVYVVLLGRLTLGFVFGLSGAAKVANVRGFTESVQQLQLVPAVLVRPFAVAVLAVEVGVAASLLAGVALQAACITILVLLAAFTYAIVRSLREGREVVCRCFGELSNEAASWSGVLRNTLLAALATATLATSAMGGQQPVAIEQAVTASLVSLGVLVLFAVASEIAALIRSQYR